MQATVPPVWSEIERYRRRRGRVTLAELSEITARAHQMHMQELRRLRELHARLDWPHVHHPEILLYTPNQLRQLIRLGNSADPAAQPTSGSSWRPGPLGAPWHLPDHEASTAGGGGPEHTSEWWSWRGWGAGALLLMAALLLVRATDRCFTRSYTRCTSSRRRRSEEWPTPNVLATSNRHPLSVDAETSPNEFDAYPSESSDSGNDVIFNADLPPPYSECATDGSKLITREEPPPPYSACYVAFSNPKDGTPSVRFFNGQRQSMFESDDSPTSTRFINVQTSTEELTEIAHSSNGFNHFDTGQLPNNPIGNRIYKLPYFDNTSTNIETDDSDECNGECIANSVECINIGPAPLATQDMTIDISEASVTINIEDRNEATESC
ncbi:uncharacterized protein LOC126777555 isoform X2 [Nymphalis io]|uniref:uncharacterized protein LOC126777555 isoform X2 n=1 Tax=Inachis io TaxID=171585 RepID=UPI00216A968B|nr:uncharacterized protein LOC126777555 isoform X2 [Nymphalis io]